MKNSKSILKIKLVIARLLYLLIDRLIRDSNSNKALLKGKIYFGTTIISLSFLMGSCGPTTVNNENSSPDTSSSGKKKPVNDSVKANPKCLNKENSKLVKSPVTIMLPPEVTCYDYVDTTIVLPPPPEDTVYVTCYLVIDTNDPAAIEDTIAIAEQMPEFVGGDDSMHRFISQNMQYPADALDMGVFGKVFISFVINKDGNVINPRIVRSVYPSLDEEAIRIIKLMPKWIPGKQNGVPANVTLTIPIKFIIAN